MTEQDLTNKIIRDANKEAEVIKQKAKAEANNKIEQAKLDVANRKTEAIELAKKKLELDQEQVKKANDVELIKARINAKQSVMNEAFNKARQSLLDADANEVKKIVNGLIKNYAATNDTVLISRRWAKALPLLKPTDEIDGGIIIEGKAYRIELSVDVLLESLREKIGLKVAKILGVM